MLNPFELCQASKTRRLTHVLPQPERPPTGTRETARGVAAQPETAPEITVRDLLIELHRIGQIVHEIERVLSLLEASEANRSSSTH
jgi:hypothetical protein